MENFTNEGVKVRKQNDEHCLVASFFAKCEELVLMLATNSCTVYSGEKSVQIHTSVRSSRCVVVSMVISKVVLLSLAKVVNHEHQVQTSLICIKPPLPGDLCDGAMSLRTRAPTVWRLGQVVPRLPPSRPDASCGDVIGGGATYPQGLTH